MMWLDFFSALALVLVFEGILPFIKPEVWRKTMGRIADRPNMALRWMGLMSMLMGVAILYAVRS